VFALESEVISKIRMVVLTNNTYLGGPNQIFSQNQQNIVPSWRTMMTAFVKSN